MYVSLQMGILADGYLNESGTISTKRLQVVLDEMDNWGQEVFEKEYADLNWYKGKQLKPVKEMEMGYKRSKLGAYRLWRQLFTQHLTPRFFAE